MTFKEKMKEMLAECGMFPDQAEAVVAEAMAAPENEAMKGRWNDQIDGYPPVICNVMWLSVKSAALAYIDRECPQAWFRPMFL